VKFSLIPRLHFLAHCGRWGELLYGVIDTFLTNQKLKEVLANAAQIAA